MFSYCISGLSVFSEVELPGLIPTVPDGMVPEVYLRRAAVPQSLDGATDKGPTWAFTADHFLLRIPGIARFLLTKGRDIAFEAEGETPLAEMAIFLIGTVFGILLHQRGNIVLHASAIRVGDKAVLFCGASGAGKSTLAAALGKSGYPLIADDVCAISFNAADEPLAHPDGRQMKLWTEAIERLDLVEMRRDPVRTSIQKFYVEPQQGTFAHPLPVAALYMLRETRPPHATGIGRPNVVDAALTLRRNAYRPQLVQRMGQRVDYFRAATLIANKADIFDLTRPLDFALMLEIVALLEGHWAETGLAVGAA